MLPPLLRAVCVSETRFPDPSNTGCDGAPPARTSCCPGKMIEVSSGSEFLRTIVTFWPSFTHRFGPGYWNGWPLGAKLHMWTRLSSGVEIWPLLAVRLKTPLELVVHTSPGGAG